MLQRLRAGLATGDHRRRSAERGRGLRCDAGHDHPHRRHDRGHVWRSPALHFIADKKAGDITGQGINQFGAKWYVLAPNGTKIDTAHAAVPPSTNYGY